MSQAPAQASAIARKAAQSHDWATVKACAGEILRRDATSAEGHFLAGLVEKAARRPVAAAECFVRALALDSSRYDAAIELASRYSVMDRHPEAFALLQRFESRLANSPRYLDIAGLTYSTIGLHARAWPLYRRANDLQPDVPRFMANLAACSVNLGRVEEAKALYRSLLDRNPAHQRNHYELSRLEPAQDVSHVDQMKAVLQSTKLTPERNIFLYYAIGKELEDLGRWQEAFEYYRKAGDAVTSVSNYDVADDIRLIETIIRVCDSAWLGSGADAVPASGGGGAPIFIVGLPRTGSTLIERIVANHSRVESIGETMQFQAALRRVSGVPTPDPMNSDIIAAVAARDVGLVAGSYLDAIRYRLTGKPMFIEKFPDNFLYLGFIAKAWSDARFVYPRRHPMDTCFAMYKQSFFRYAYTLENVGRYYVAHDRLLQHWRSLLSDRLVEVQYESLVADQEGQTRMLLARLGLDFEPACLEFEKNAAASATASAVQVREKIHARSIGRWRRFSKELEPLRALLERSGIETG